jgi:geranylgeranyl pyrophosphate synthase
MIAPFTQLSHSSASRRGAPCPPACAGEDALLHCAFRRLLPVPPFAESRLQGVLDDTLAHPGSLLRARLAFGILARRGTPPEATLRPAIAIEYFHTASLLFDDLPCMDDAGERRGRPCPHRVYGEAAAILGALAFVNQGYALLWEALAPLPESRRRRAAACVADCLGVSGILDGQSRDIHFRESAGRAQDVLDIALGKTATLLRLTLVLPAIMAGAGEAELAELERLAIAWGLGYQILDDCKDCLLSARETGKSTGVDAVRGRPNLVHAAGLEAALDHLEAALTDGQEALSRLLAADGRWAPLFTVQTLLESQAVDHVGRGRIAVSC